MQILALESPPGAGNPKARGPRGPSRLEELRRERRGASKAVLHERPKKTSSRARINAVATGLRIPANPDSCSVLARPAGP
jgi:hypothetical protein